jgi:transposase InsO family protein
MPWKETCVVDERVRFIAAVEEDPRGNFARLCREFGISRSNGYKWLARYEAEKARGLHDKPSTPRSCPHKTPAAIADLVVALRKRHPFDGPKKLRAQLVAEHPELVIPAASTIGDILKRNALIRPPRARLRTAPSRAPLEGATHANATWCADFKGHFPLGDGARCHPLTITDAFSRYLIRCEALEKPRFEPVCEHFERAFTEFGLPDRIRTDNGPPFASGAVGGLSKLSVWWIRLGIVPERIEPGHPEQNGRHERMHRTLKQHTATPPRSGMTEQQRAFDAFRFDFNDRRPHEALGQTPPAKHYEPSRRPMPSKLPNLVYGEEFVVRHADHAGSFSFKHQLIGCGSPLAHQAIGVKQTGDEEWELYFGPVLLAFLERRQGKLHMEPFR